jgi:RNA polymerase sigma factor (sigma-70 family)
MSNPSAHRDALVEASPAAVEGERRHLLNVAYRLLGSVVEAEDVVQETFSRWYAMTPGERQAIASPGAWLTKVAGRICIDVLRSARVRRERYVGEWLPEPLPLGSEWAGAPSVTAADPADRITLDESVSMAFLVVLDAMTPAERVAFVLHDVFRFAFADIAEIVGRSPAACRQLASSARRRIQASRGTATPQGRRADVVRAFRQAWEAKDVGSIVRLLDPEAVVVADSGGKVEAAREPIEGAERIARALVEVAAPSADLAILERTVNGEPGLVVQLRGVTVTVLAFDVRGDVITRIWSMRNPDKLQPWVAPAPA